MTPIHKEGKLSKEKYDINVLIMEDNKRDRESIIKITGYVLTVILVIATYIFFYYLMKLRCLGCTI
jgi:hypothetical protein